MDHKKTFIHELTSDFETEMKLNDVLLEELQSLVSKIADIQVVYQNTSNCIKIHKLLGGRKCIR